MKTLRRLIKQNRIWVILSVFMTFLSIITQFVWTVNIGKLADAIVAREKVKMDFVITMLIILMIICTSLYLKDMVNRYTSERMAHRLRMDFVKKILNSKTMDSMCGHEAMSKAQNELMQASDYMSNTLFDIVGMFLSGLFALIYLIFENALLTAIILFAMVPIVIFVNVIGKKLIPLANASMDKKTVHNKVAYSLISKFDIVKIFDAKDFFKGRYEEELDDWAKTETKKERISAVCNSLSGILSQVPLLVLFAVSAIFIWKGYMTIGKLIIFINMLSSLLISMMNLPSWMVSIKNFLVHLTRADI